MTNHMMTVMNDISTMIIYTVNNIPHGYALFRRIMVQSDTRCAQKSLSSYNICDHLGSSILHGHKSDALVPDRLHVKTGRPAHGRVLIHNLNGLLDGVVSGDWVLRR